jgi:hypothetical protein
MKSVVTVYKFYWTEETFNKREEWFQDREQGIVYTSKLSGEKAAEEVFHLTNAPEECLTEAQKSLLQFLEFKGPSLSVGDIVRVEEYPKYHSGPAEYYLCKSFGWEKFQGDVIELMKWLSW